MAVDIVVGTSFINIAGAPYVKGQLRPVYDGDYVKLMYGATNNQSVIERTIWSDFTNDGLPFADLDEFKTFVDANFGIASISGGDSNAANQVIGNNKLTEINNKLGSLQFIPIVPAIDATTPYTAGDCLGSLNTLADAMRVNDGTGKLASISIRDIGDKKMPIDVWIFDAEPAASTFTNNAAPVIDAADLAKLVAKVSIVALDYSSGGGVAIATKSGINLPVAANGGTKDLYAVFIIQGVTTYATVADITAIFGFDQL